MSIASSLLCLVIASIPAQTEQQVVAGPDGLRGRVLDLFDGDKVLLSVGSDQGVKKGMKGFVTRANTSPLSYCVEVEFMEVGVKHSIMKIRNYLSYNNPYDAGLLLLPPPAAKAPFDSFMKSIRLQAYDSFVWHSTSPWDRPPFELSRQSLPGGAVIDLTTPEGRSMVPGR